MIDLPAVVDRFATAFEFLPEIVEGLPSARMLIATGRLVARFVVYGLEAPDGSSTSSGLTWTSEVRSSGRYWARTSDLCRVKARDGWQEARDTGFLLVTDWFGLTASDRG